MRLGLWDFMNPPSDGKEKLILPAILESMDGGGNHTDAEVFEWDVDTSDWKIIVSDKESYAINELRKEIMKTGIDRSTADILLSAVWRKTEEKPPGYGRVRLRLFEVVLYLCDTYIGGNWSESLSDRAKFHLAKLREIVSHIPPPRRVIVRSVGKSGWWLLEGTKCA